MKGSHFYARQDLSLTPPPLLESTSGDPIPSPPGHPDPASQGEAPGKAPTRTAGEKEEKPWVFHEIFSGIFMGCSVGFSWGFMFFFFLVFFMGFLMGFSMRQVLDLELGFHGMIFPMEF